MGRFYKTSSAMPLDYMYSINAPLMEKAITFNDQAITNNLSEVDKEKQLINFDYVDKDKDNALAIQKQLQQKADDLATAIHNDPANWRKQQPQLRQFKQDLLNNFQSGEISKYVESATNRKAKLADLQKQVDLYNKTGGKDKNGNPVGIDPVTAKMYIDKWDSDFQGTKTATGFSPYKGGEAMNNMDVEGVLAKGVKDMKANGTIIESPTQSGMYLIQTTKGLKALTPERILEAMQGNITPELTSYLRNRSDIGQIKGAFDAQGNFISPYNSVPQKLSSQEQSEINLKQSEINQLRKKDPTKAEEMQQQLDSQLEDLKDRKQIEWNSDSYLSPIMQGIINKHAYSESTSKTKLLADPVSLPVWQTQQKNQQQALDRENRWNINQANITSREKEGQLNRDAKKALQDAHNAEDIDKAKLKIQNNPNLSPAQKSAMIKDVETTDTFIKDSNKAFDLPTIKAKSNEYLSLINEQAKNGSLDDSKQDRLNQLNILFDGAAKKLNVTPQQMQTVLKFNSGEQFGSKIDPATDLLVTTPEYRQAKLLSEKVLGKQKDNKLNTEALYDKIWKNSSIDDLAYVPSNKTTEGKATFDLINKLFDSGVGKHYMRAGETYYNEDGTLKPSNFNAKVAEVLGDGISSADASKDVLAYLVKQGGGKPTDYIKGLKVKMDGNKLIVSGRISTGNGIKSGHWYQPDIDDNNIAVEGDQGGDNSNFQLVFDDFDNGIRNIYGNSKTFKDSPSGKAFLDRVDPAIAITQNKVNAALPYLSRKGQKKNINGILVENVGDKYTVTIDGTKYDTYGGEPIVLPDQLKAIVAEKTF